MKFHAVAQNNMLKIPLKAVTKANHPIRKRAHNAHLGISGILISLFFILTGRL